MRLTDRDRMLLRDIALSHVLTREQLIALGYFGSITRANTRLRELRESGYVRALDTPFYSQRLHGVGRAALPILGARIEHLVAGRRGSPRFLQHALATTEVRLALLKKLGGTWRFEQQARTSFTFAGKSFEVRPDGLLLMNRAVTAIEVDLGHVAPAKFREKLRAYDFFISSGEAARQWHTATISILTVTTGTRRAAHLGALAPVAAHFPFSATTFRELGLPLVGSWS